MKAIVSVFAKDQKGIIAYVTQILADNGINILDISQTLMQEYFAMIMLVDTSDCELTFDALSALLKEKGKEKNLSVQIQREDIFNSMHKI
ncbi:MAG: ACT domain-containing protein [Firmicutes bacterium]|nr:ACT domain-containing protein [Bacillota bacterium]